MFLKVTGFLIALFLAFLAKEAAAQGTSGATAPYESRYIVDLPTAGMVAKGGYSAFGVASGGGNVMLEFYVAPFANFNLGLSYSASNIIGSNDAAWQNLPGFHIRIRIFNEKKNFPAIVIGANSQGRGIFDPNEKRCQTLSPCIFAALSKNYKWTLGTIAFHGGITYSFDPLPPLRSINLYAGFEHSVGNRASINIEFNPNLDDSNSKFLDKKGLLNLALRWSIIRGATLEFQMRDLFIHLKGSSSFSRGFAFEYIGSF